MNKGVNTAIFVVAASLVNVVLMLVFLLVGTLIVVRLVPAETAAAAGPFIMMGVFVGAMALTFFVYGRLIKFARNRFKLDDYLHPIFRKKK